MESPKLRSLLLWLLASVVVTITFRLATTSKTTHSKPTRSTTYYSRIEREPSGHLLAMALRKADFPQTLSASERAVLAEPLRMPSGITLLPDHSLMVENVHVVEDPTLTWDQCLTPSGNPTGAWTFNTLMTNIRNGSTQQAEQMLTDLIANFAHDITVNNFTVHGRPNGMEFFNNWPRDTNPNNMCTNPISASTACLSLANAPVHLNAIVNRIDIGQNGNSDQAGQLRFVFGVEMFKDGTLECGTGVPFFNIILEYDVPSIDMFTGAPITAQNWAAQWANLSTLCLPTISATCAQNSLDPALLAITRQVTTAGAGGASAPNGSALFDLRTNEVELNTSGLVNNGIQVGTWELRQFQLGQQPTPNLLVQTTVPQTPDLSFDGGIVPGAQGNLFCSNSGQLPTCNSVLSEVEQLIATNTTSIINGTFNLAQVAPAVVGGSSLNGPFGQGTGDFRTFWDSSPTMGNAGQLYTPRVIFAASPQFLNSQTHNPDPVGGTDGTCNGCHGGETQTNFQQIVNRTSGTGSDTASTFSAFLVGCNNGGTPLTAACLTPFPLNSSQTEVVKDPVFSSFTNTFGDIERRVNCMNKILNPGSPLQVSCNGAGQ